MSIQIVQHRTVQSLLYNGQYVNMRPDILQSNPSAVLGTDGSGNIVHRAVNVSGGPPLLNNLGQIDSTQLPSYIQEIQEYADLASFPVVGLPGTIYIAVDTNLNYRWNGSSYYALANIGFYSQTACDQRFLQISNNGGVRQIATINVDGDVHCNRVLSHNNNTAVIQLGSWCELLTQIDMLNNAIINASNITATVCTIPTIHSTNIDSQSMAMNNCTVTGQVNTNTLAATGNVAAGSFSTASTVGCATLNSTTTNATVVNTVDIGVAGIYNATANLRIGLGSWITAYAKLEMGANDLRGTNTNGSPNYQSNIFSNLHTGVRCWQIPFTLNGNATQQVTWAVDVPCTFRSLVNVTFTYESAANHWISLPTTEFILDSIGVVRATLAGSGIGLLGKNASMNVHLLPVA